MIQAATAGEKKPLLQRPTKRPTQKDLEDPKSRMTLLWAGDVASEETKATGKVLDSSMNLAACAFGASMLSLSYAMDISGGAVAVFLIVTLGLMAVLAGNSIMNAGYRFTRSTYPQIVEEAFGKTSGIVCEVLLSLCLFVAAVSYVVGLADLLPDMISLFSYLSRPMRIITIYVGLFPLTLVGSLAAFGPASLFACVGCYVQAVALVYAAAVSDIPAPTQTTVFSVNPVGVIFSLPMVTFTYAFHYVLTDTFLELKGPSRSRLMTTTWITTGTLGLCYILVGVSGYLLYGGKGIPSNVLSGFSEGSVVIAIARWSIGCLLFVTYSLFIIPLRRRLEELYYGSQTKELNYQRIVVASAIGFIVICTSLGLPDLSLANTVAGGCIALVMFVFPGLLDIYRYRKFVEDRSQVQLARGILLLSVGSVAGFIGLFGNFLPISP